jgi:hypothetical protein
MVRSLSIEETRAMFDDWRKRRQRKKTPFRQTVRGRKRFAAVGRRNVRLAQSARRKWYDPRADYWTLTAECPEWADEMRRLERLRYHRRRLGN